MKLKESREQILTSTLSELKVNRLNMLKYTIVEIINNNCKTKKQNPTLENLNV